MGIRTGNDVVMKPMMCMQCKAVLGKLQGAMNKEGRKIAALFMELPKHSEMPDYYKVIARPISAHTIEERLDRFEYASVLEFAADVHLMLGNAARFHSDSLEVIASTFESEFSPFKHVSFVDEECVYFHLPFPNCGCYNRFKLMPDAYKLCLNDEWG